MVACGKVMGKAGNAVSQKRAREGGETESGETEGREREARQTDREGGRQCCYSKRRCC